MDFFGVVGLQSFGRREIREKARVGWYVNERSWGNCILFDSAKNKIGKEDKFLKYMEESRFCFDSIHAIQSSCVSLSSVIPVMTFFWFSAFIYRVNSKSLSK